MEYTAPQLKYFLEDEKDDTMIVQLMSAKKYARNNLVTFENTNGVIITSQLKELLEGKNTTVRDIVELYL